MNINIEPKTHSYPIIRFIWDEKLLFGCHTSSIQFFAYFSSAQKSFLSFFRCVFDELRFTGLSRWWFNACMVEIKCYIDANEIFMNESWYHIIFLPQQSHTLFIFSVFIYKTICGFSLRIKNKKNHLITGIWSYGAPIRSAYTHFLPFCIPSGIMSFPQTEKKQEYFRCIFSNIFIWNILFVLNYKVCAYTFRMYDYELCTQSSHFSRYW